MLFSDADEAIGTVELYDHCFKLRSPGFAVNVESF